LKIVKNTSQIKPPEPAVPPISARIPLYLDLIRWNRPAGWLLLLWPSLSALWIAANGFPGWHLLTVFTLGTILMRSAGCCLNDVADRDFDKHVKRTAQRPVTRGAVSVKEALMLGALLALLAFALVLTTNAATVMWSFAALGIAIIYPYAKRFFAMPQAVLGVAFSFGIPMAFAAVQGGDSFSFSAVQGSVPLTAWILLWGNLFWVLAYDTEYAMVDRDDDLKIGMKTSAITLGRWDVPVVAVFYLIYLSIWAVTPARQAQTAIYFIAILIAGAQAVWHITLIRGRSREGCFKAFRLNHWLGFTVFLGLVMGYAINPLG
jgi:4-hydroxybenzoate polyprenyltransferase